ncbi:hypothetical protein D9M71_324850 [compost metagenome]
MGHRQLKTVNGPLVNVNGHRIDRAGWPDCSESRNFHLEPFGDFRCTQQINLSPFNILLCVSGNRRIEQIPKTSRLRRSRLGCCDQHAGCLFKLGHLGIS